MPKGLSTSYSDPSLIVADQTAAPARRTTRKSGLAATLAAGLFLSGCASPVIGAITIGEITTVANIVSTFMTGRDLTEHALSTATGQDCRILESMLNSDRKFCEDEGSAATAGDFEGVLALLNQDGAETAMAYAEVEARRATDPAALGFAPIDRRVAMENFSLETAASQAVPSRTQPVAFGMLQASYSQTWSYEMTARRDTQHAEAPAADATRVASAAPQALPAVRSDGIEIIPEPVLN